MCLCNAFTTENEPLLRKTGLNGLQELSFGEARIGELSGLVRELHPQAGIDGTGAGADMPEAPSAHG